MALVNWDQTMIWTWMVRLIFYDALVGYFVHLIILFVLDDEENYSKRPITYEIAKNKGLTPHRKKELRNPRVKHRMKYRKAKIRRKGQVHYCFYDLCYILIFIREMKFCYHTNLMIVREQITNFSYHLPHSGVPIMTSWVTCIISLCLYSLMEVKNWGISSSFFCSNFDDGSKFSISYS